MSKNADSVDRKKEKGVNEEQQNINSDPQDLPQLGKEKRIIAPDPEKVKEAERKGRGTKPMSGAR